MVTVTARIGRWGRREAEKMLGGLAELRFAEGSGIVEAVKDAEVVICGPLPREAIAAAQRLRFVQTLSAGVDRLDLDLLRHKGVLLASARGCNARAVAEHALALILSLAKRVVEMDREVKLDRWPGYTRSTMVGDLAGKTLGIVGYGSIGRELARMARALGMRIIAVKRTPAPSDGVAEWVGGMGDLGKLLSESDFVVLSVPLTPETRGLIGEDELRMMKKTAYLVNVSRGPVVDEEALYKALTEGWIAGAGIDVWWEYPPSPCAPSRLGVHKLPNVIATPHVGGWTEEAWRSCVKFAIRNVARYLRGEKPLNLVDYERGY